MAALEVEYRPHARWFVGAEGTRFKRTKGTDYKGRSWDQVLLKLGGGLVLPPLINAHPQHRLSLGGQVEFGRIGGASFEFPNWVWQRGGSIFVTYNGRSSVSGIIRAYIVTMSILMAAEPGCVFHTV